MGMIQCCGVWAYCVAVYVEVEVLCLSVVIVGGEGVRG